MSNDSFEESMSKIANCLLKTYDDLIFLGDANCCPLKSDTIKDICDTYGLSNLIMEPTCHKGTVSTLLDIILVTNSKRYSGVLNANFCLSDEHNIVGAATKRFVPSQKPRKISYTSFKYFNDTDVLYTTCHVRHSMLLTSLTMSMTWHGTPALWYPILSIIMPL